jgi:glycine cleavage system H protein
MTVESGSIPEDLKYTDEHEWVRMEGGLARVGITEFAQAQLGDVVYVEAPSVGDSVEAGKAFGVVESVKAASDLFCPISGSVSEVNERLMEDPELVNTDPYGEGWIVAIEPADPAEIEALLDAKAYAELLEESE